MRTRPLFGLVLLAAASLSGCKTGGDAEYAPPAAKCDADKDCAKGFVCEAKVCKKGERSAAELKARKAAEEAAKQKARDAEKATKPGEGRLYVRICPGFQNTQESIGTLVATHTKTGKTFTKHLALDVPEGGWETEFTFWSVPLGDYEITAKYGIQVKGQPDISQLKCHEKVDKKACKDELVILKSVIPPDQEAPREKDKDGTFKRRPCDFTAE